MYRKKVEKGINKEIKDIDKDKALSNLVKIFISIRQEN
jgi:hypothetical protein